MYTKIKKIKILFLIDRLLKGGTENQLLWLAENLPSDKFSPVIGVLKDTQFSDSLEISTPIVRFGVSGPRVLKNIRTLKKLKEYLVQKKVDIVQTQFPTSEFYGAISVKSSKRKTFLISTRRNLYHWKKGVKSELIFLLTKLAAKKADFVLANSYKVKELCNLKERVPLEKIMVIQNGVDTSRFEKILKEEAKNRFGYSGTFPIIGVIGNWRPIKGVMPFLKAANVILKEVPSSKFVLVGFGPQELELKDFVQTLGLQDSVKFLDNSTDIPSVMATIDIAVQPSLSESFSNVLVEYMAAAKPIVATETGDVKHVLDNGRCGLIVRTGDHGALASAIISLCKDFNYAEKLGGLAYERVQANWDSDIVLKKYISFYSSLFSMA